MLRDQIRQQPLAKMWRERRRKNQPRMQGTESKALEQLERNRTAFRYPKDGFEQKIEFSLLYAMLAEPDTYPKEVVQATIDEEDFLQYIHTKNEDVSYAQLSAILAYSAENNPTATTAAKTAASEKEAEDSNDVKQPISISQKLCKKILRTIIKYAEEHELDRETEIDELFKPVRRVATQRIEKKELQAILPLYLGYSAALLTANPLPLIAGAMGLMAAPSNQADIQNVEHIIAETDRAADVERTGLLDEGDDV